MIKLIKEIFSSENLKRAMIYGSFTNPNITASQLKNLSSVLKNMDAKDINKSITKDSNSKKVA
ncbi:hypothetical protein [Clostridium saccharoperbutylacetonicum]